jgi:hypothetical protein
MDALRALLLSMRLTIDAALAMTEPEAPAAPDAGGPCEHPLEQRRGANAMGREQFVCLACGQLVVTKEDHGAADVH